MSKTVALPYDTILEAEEVAPARHHIDKRVDAILERTQQANPDELLTTKATADWLGVSIQFLEVGRSRGYGPPFRRISARMIRYQRGDVLTWLADRKHARTAEYMVKLIGIAE